MTQQRGLAALALVAILIAIFPARPPATHGIFARDFEAYWSGGAAWNAHANPYGREVWRYERTVPGVDATRDELLPFVGPPASLLLWGALARLPYGIASVLWYGALTLCLALLIALCILASGGKLTAGAFFTSLLLAIAFGPVTSDLALGQVALLAVAAATTVVVAGASAALRWRAVATAGAFVSLLQPNVALGLLSQGGRNVMTAAIGAGAAATYVAGAITAGWTWPVTYGRELLEHQSGERFSAIQMTVASTGHGLGLPDAAVTVLGIVTAVVAIVAGVAICASVGSPFARFASCSALVPFVTGFFHEHDLVVAFPGVIWCAFRTNGTSRSIALAGTFMIAVDWFGLAQRPAGIAQSALLAFAATSAFVSLSDRVDIRREATVACFLAALFCAAAWLAAWHPAPVWPDTLGAFHASPAASAADVWHAEQVQSGLVKIVPAWAILRALALAGCAMLAASIARADRRALRSSGPHAAGRLCRDPIA